MFGPVMQPIPSGVPGKGYSKTVTNTAAAVTTDNVPCHFVYLQSSELNDSDVEVTAKMYVILGASTNPKSHELRQGESIWIQCANANEIYVVTQSGTAWCRMLVYRFPEA